MKWMIITFIIFLSQSAQAACYVDYKAKQGNPLKLHYGIMKLDSSECVTGYVQDKVALRLLPPWLDLVECINGVSQITKLPTERKCW